MATRAYLTVIAVFIAGFILGGASMPLIFIHGPFWDRHHRHPDSGGEKLVERLSRDLQLSDNQIEQVRPYILELDRQLRDLQKETTPKIQAIIQDSVRKVEPFLSSSQKDELHTIAARLPPPPPPHPGQ